MAEILVFQRRKNPSVESRYGTALQILTEQEKAKQALLRNQYQMILIDLEGVEQEGIEVAFFARGLKQYFRTPILFFARDAMYEKLAFHHIHCYDFLLKPIHKNEIAEILCLYLMQKEIQKENRRVSIPARNSVYLLYVRDILYMESMNRHVYVHLKNQTLEVPYRKLCDCIAFDKEKFIQCHRSFVVNRDYIYRMDYSGHWLELREGLGKIKMGRKYEKELRQKFDRGFPLEYTV